MDELIIIGKTVSTHGIKGELKVISDFEYADIAFRVNNEIMINNKIHKITSIRYHKNYILLGIDNLDNINLVLEYVGFNVYIYRSTLNLDEDEYLNSDLISAKVMEDNEIIGIVIEVVKSSQYDYIKVINNNKEFLIPLIEEYIKKFDKKEKILYTINAKNLIF